jgi:hypothetical protein
MARSSQRGFTLHRKHCQSSDSMSSRTERFRFCLMHLYKQKTKSENIYCMKYICHISQLYTYSFHS